MSPATDRRAASAAQLDQLVGAGLLGAALVSRDGLPVLCRFSRSVNQETFSAMSAALMGAAEAALMEWAEDRPGRASVEGARVRMVAVGLDADYLLVAVADAAVDRPRADAAVDKAAAGLRALLLQG